MHTMKRLTNLFLLLATVWLAACSTTSSISNGGALDAGAKWALLPLANHTDTPQAALAADVGGPRSRPARRRCARELR